MSNYNVYDEIVRFIFTQFRVNMIRRDTMPIFHYVSSSLASITSISIPNNRGGKVSVVNHFFWTNLSSHQIIYYHQCHKLKKTVRLS
jgi:hypothetical protein